MKRTMFMVWIAAVVLVGQPLASQTPGSTSLEIRTLSTRPDTVSGGDVLVQIAVPRNVAADRIAVTLNGRDVRAAFRPGAQQQTLAGLVTGLNIGSNQIQVSAPGERRVQITVVSHPITGPVIAGPHQTPFVCETEAFGLGPANDTNCSVSTRVDYFYRVRVPASPQLESPTANSAAALAAVDAAVPRPGGGGGGGGAAPNPFKPFDPSAPRPADLAKTTTNDGRTVPYIVRVDSGTINRTIYRIAILDDPNPEANGSGWAPGAGWNGKLAFSFGGGAGTDRAEVQKRWLEFASDTLNKQRALLDSLYRSGIELIEHAFRVTEAKSPEDYRRLVEELWRKLSDSFKAQSEAQLREFQDATAKWLERAQVGKSPS